MKRKLSLVLAGVLVCMGAWAQQQSGNEEEFRADAQRLEEHFKREMEELRGYLSEMMKRQSDLSELVKSLAESGKEAAGETAKQVLEDAEAALEKQRENMESRIQRMQDDLHAREEAARVREAEARARAEQAIEREEEMRRTAQEQDRVVSRVINVEHVSMNQVLPVLEPLFDVEVSADPGAGIIGVRGPVAYVDAFEEAVARLDVPRQAVKNIELRVHLLGATKQADALDAEISDEIVDVLASLQGVFPYKDWGLLETTYVRCRDGEPAHLSGHFTGGSGDAGYGGASQAQVYQFILSSGRVAVNPESGSIAVDNLQLQLQSNHAAAEIKVDINLEDGQRAVVGKASMTGGLDAVFLVVSAKIL